MKLNAWLKKKKVSVDIFAWMVDYNRSTVYHWVKGTCKPRNRAIRAIEQATEGHVTLKDWK